MSPIEAFMAWFDRTDPRLMYLAVVTPMYIMTLWIVVHEAAKRFRSRK